MIWTTPDRICPWLHNVAARDGEWNIEDFPWKEIREFEGPAAAHVLGLQFVEMTHDGIVNETRDALSKCWNEAEAWDKFIQHLKEYVKDAQQIAWRIMPECDQGMNGAWRVYARLYKFV